MFQIGPSLREARTRRGFSPADVHKAVRIRERYLTALEEERWEMLPGDAYTKGFLRTYAEFLGLDGQLYIDEFNARIAQHDEEPLVPEVLKKQGRAGGILFRTIGAVLLLGAAIAGLAAWRHAGTPARPTIDAAAAAPKPTAAVKPQIHHVAAPAAKKTKPAVAPKPTFTIIRAVRDRSWLSVRLGGPLGKEIFRGTLEPGHFLKYGLHRPIWVRMGRPLALDIRIGKTLVAGLPDATANVLLTRNGATR
jgi:cytoskeleton protein RodZ